VKDPSTDKLQEQEKGILELVIGSRLFEGCKHCAGEGGVGMVGSKESSEVKESPYYVGDYFILSL
jgi:hypothetical protein